MLDEALDTALDGPIVRGVERTGPEPERENFGEGQSANPPDDPMIEPDADPLDTDVEDADLFLGLEEDDEDPPATS